MNSGAWSEALAGPIFESLRPSLARLAAGEFPSLEQLNALIGASTVSGGGAPIRFVPPRKAVGSYELRIFETGEVQTRPENWHDLFNALVWLGFPRTKAVLNRHHRAEIVARRGEPHRGTARDVLTLFDEGGVIVGSADPALSVLLRRSMWKELFWTRRVDVRRSMRFDVFGHAIFEKALAPYKGVTAKALIVDLPPALLDVPVDAWLAEIDARAARHFSSAEALASTRSLPPLPILGVPGWEPANQSEEYYGDASQFRQRREDA